MNDPGLRDRRIDVQARELQRDTAALLARRARPRRHHLACGMRLAAGQRVLGINVVSNLGPGSTCAEQLTLAGVLRDCPEEKVQLVLTLRATFDPADPYELVAPCGRCRELLCEYAPDAYVVLPGSQAGRQFDLVTVINLLPSPFRRRVITVLPHTSERPTHTNNGEEDETGPAGPALFQ